MHVCVCVCVCVHVCMCDVCGTCLRLRLGGGEPDAEEVKKHIFFESIDWQQLYDRNVSFDDRRR